MINLPKNNLGVMNEYTLEVDDYINGLHIHKLYVYGMQGILIYNLNLTNWEDVPVKIGFANEVTGFYDRPFTDLLELPARVPMIYIHDEHCPGQIFAVGPDLRLWYINATDDTPYQCQIPSGLIGYKLSSAKLVYDNHYSRIVWMIRGMANNSENSKSWLCTVNLSSSNYPIQIVQCLDFIITDFAINDIVGNNIIYVGVFTGDDTGYWALLDRDDFQPVPGKQVPVNFRPGLIQYVHTDDVHQVYCLPGVNPSTTTTTIKIYEGDISSHDPLTMLSPAAGYTCAGFNDYHNHLFLGAYAEPTVTEFNDVYVFQFQNNTSPPVIKCSLNTYQPSEVRQNAPLAIKSVNDDQVLVMKRHEIIQLNYTVNNPCPYSYIKLLGAYANCFRNAEVTDDSRIFITKLSGGFLEYDISNIPWLLTDHQTGHSVHSSILSSLTGKKYFYSKDHFANGDLFIDENTGGSSLINYPLTNPVGDCIFNPFQNQVLISDFTGSPNLYLKAYSEIPGGLSTQYSMSMDIGTFNSKMTVSRNGELLLLTGVNNVEPKIKIFDATVAHYAFIAQIDLTGYFTGSDWLEVAYADNKYQTYFVVGDAYDPDSERTLPETQSTSYFFVLDPGNYPLSPHIEIDHDNPRFLETMQEGEFEETTLYKAFIAGTEPYFTEVSIEGHNLNMVATHKQVMNPITALKLISYYGESGIVNKLYITTWNGSSTAIWTYEPGTDENPVEIAQIDTYISKMDYNEKTLLLYLYGIENDELRLAQMDVLGQFDGEVKELNIHSLPTDKLSAVVVKTNELLFDNENHVVDIPNGEFSSISRLGVSFERLPLKDKVSWISFPRLERFDNNPVPSQERLEKIAPIPTYIHLTHYFPENEQTYDKTKINNQWTGDLIEIISTLGYKLETDNIGISVYSLPGTVLNPNTTMLLYGLKSNWTGYYLPYTQNPFEAIGEEFLEHMNILKGQYWTCTKKDPGHTKSSESIWACACQQGRVEIKYGDMIEIYPTEDIPEFHWQMTGMQQEAESKLPSLSFHYEEQAEYDALFIELDTLDLPDEIGAFAGDSCIGATTVLPSDTMAMICAYTEGFEGEEITFELLYPTKSARPRCRDYSVLNIASGILEKRRIVAGENQPYFLVSLKSQENIPSDQTAFNVNVRPNPIKDEFTVSYFTGQEVLVELSLINALGLPVRSWQRGFQGAGNYSMTIPTAGLPSGCYYLKAKAGNAVEIQKIMIIH